MDEELDCSINLDVLDPSMRIRLAKELLQQNPNETIPTTAYIYHIKFMILYGALLDGL